MKKVAIVYHYFAHYREPVLDSLDGIGNRIFLISGGDSNEHGLNVIDFKEKSYIRTKHHRVKNFWLRGFLIQFGLGRELRSINPDAIIFLGQFNFISTWFYAVYYRLIGKDVIFWGHGVYGNEKGFKKAIRNIFNRIPHHYLTYGYYAKSLMTRSGIPSKSISVVFNSLDVNSQNRIYNKLCSTETKCSNDNFKVCFVGRLTKVKKLNLLIDSVKSLIDSGYEIFVDIVGDGPCKDELVALTRGYEAFFYFHGAQHSELYVSNVLFHSNVCVSPGNVGLTAMHSLIYGTPVITHNDFTFQMPEFEAIQDGLTGSFFDNNSLSSLTEKIIFWYKKSNDIDRSELRDVCRSYILTKYNPTYQSKIIQGVLERVKKNN